MCVSLRFLGTNFGQPPEVPLLLAELGVQERLYKVPGGGRTCRAAAEADDVDVIILDSLPRGEVVVDQRSSHSRHLIRAY
jgi:hypothetical protein